MKLFLFGGAETGEVARELKMIEKVIKKLKPKQILHIPFARTSTHEEEWQGDWFHRYIKLDPQIKYLNAEINQDLDRAKAPLLFISGGSQITNLARKLKTDKRLVPLIKAADCIIGESAGAKILGKYFRTKSNSPKISMAKGLDIIKDTVIEPHYTQRKRKKILSLGLKESGAKYGLGIDSLTAAVIDTESFPKKFKKIGVGLVDLKK
jgi:peptidase E